MNVSHKRQLIVICLGGVFSLLYFFHINEGFFLQPAKQLTCEGVLEFLQPSFPALLLDIPFLIDYQNNSCTLPKRPLKIAVSIDDKVKNVDRYHIVSYKKDSPKRMFWTFRDDVTRAIPPLDTYRMGNFLLPVDTRKFIEYWKRSTLLDCLKLDMERGSQKSYLPPTKSISALGDLVDLLVSLDMYPFLNGGTLLGWYRECAVIPHTYDMDIAVFIEQYNPKLLKMLLDGRTNFRISRKLGRVNESYELTVFPKTLSRPAIDIFFMYNNGRNESWVGGTGSNGQKYRYIYPLYNPWCSADLLGRLFWITCSPEKMLEFEYGPNWKKDHHTSKFSWSQSSYNVRKGKRWKPSEMRQVYVTY